jgi:threonine/homoserine/homoserine lactone efflux protein
MLIVANALRGGVRTGLLTVGGTSLAMAIQLGVAILGLTSLVTRLAVGQATVRWVGVAVLAYLGVRNLRSMTGVEKDMQPSKLRGGSSFVQGFLVSLTNPTTMLFFVAFFPQFLSGAGSPGEELILLGVSFWLMALVFDCAYASLAARIGRSMQDPRLAVIRNRIAGGILLIAALTLALARIRDAALV